MSYNSSGEIVFNATIAGARNVYKITSNPVAQTMISGDKAALSERAASRTMLERTMG